VYASGHPLIQPFENRTFIFTTEKKKEGTVLSKTSHDRIINNNFSGIVKKAIVYKQSTTKHIR
jgi:hypothetical protein